jgi:sugar phosphate isomerase/epimerase
MKPRIGFKGQLTTKNIFDDLNFAIENEFNCLEIGIRSYEDLVLRSETIKKIRDISGKNDISLILHPPWSLPISSPFPEIRGAVVKVAKKSIVLAKKLDADHLVLHSGYKEVSGPAAAKNYEILVKNLKEIIKFGRKYGIKIGLENSDLHSHGMCIQVEDLLEVINAVRGLKIVFDIGHANTTKTGPVKYFKKIKHFVINMHLHDNDGKTDSHLLIGEGNVNFNGLFNECKKVKYYGPFILELFPDENIINGKKRFLNIWNGV